MKLRSNAREPVHIPLKDGTMHTLRPGVEEQVTNFDPNNITVKAMFTQGLIYEVKAKGSAVTRRREGEGA